MKKRKPGRPKTGHFRAVSFRLRPEDIERIEAIRARLAEERPETKAVDAVRYAIKKAAR